MLYFSRQLNRRRKSCFRKIFSTLFRTVWCCWMPPYSWHNDRERKGNSYKSFVCHQISCVY